MKNYYKLEKNFITLNGAHKNFLKEILKFIIYWILNLFYWTLYYLDRLFARRNKANKKYYISICAIFKDEAKNLEEWIRFNIVCGVDHIYLYNNNSSDNYLAVLDAYIQSGYVDLIDWPYQHSQMKAYLHCYESKKNDSRWIGFIDIDEYICPIKEYTVKDWLFKYETLPNISIYWRQFGSSGKIESSNCEYIIEQYTQCWSKPCTFTKIFFNTQYDISVFDNPHVASNKIFHFNFPTINQFGKFILLGIHRGNNNIEIQLNHYWGQAYNTFIEKKINKTDVFHEDDGYMSMLRMRILKEYELLCTSKDFTIHKFLLHMKKDL